MSIESDLESISDRYAHGECGAFAVACHQNYRAHGWELVLFFSGTTPIHACCEVPGVGYFDAYGFISLDVINGRYSVPLTVEWADENSIQAAMGFDDEDVSEADDHLRLLEELLEKAGKIERHGSAISPI